MTHTHKCPDCKGKGEVHGTTCEPCKGSGYLVNVSKELPIDEPVVTNVVRYSDDGGQTWHEYDTNWFFPIRRPEDAQAVVERLRRVAAQEDFPHPGRAYRVSRKKVSYWDMTIFRIAELEEARRILEEQSR